MSNARTVLVITAAAVAAAIVALWVVSGGDEPSPARPAPRSPGPVASDRKIPDSAAVVPAPGAAHDGSAAGAGSAVKDYVIGDVHVRDHRSGDHPMLDLPPTAHAPRERLIASTLTAELAQRLTASTRDCGAAVPAEARGDKPRVDGTVVIAIKDHQVTIKSAMFQARDVTGDAADRAKQCFEAKAVGMAVAAPDEADLESYSISMQLRLP